MANIHEIILKRCSVRKFPERCPNPDLIRRLLDAATAAPNACNSQPWEFIVVTETDKLNRLREKVKFGHYIAPCAIVVCRNPREVTPL